MGQRFTVERVVEPKDREAFDAYVLERLPTWDEATEWLQAKGYRIHRNCVGGYIAALKVREAASDAADLLKEALGPNLDMADATQRLIMAQLQQTLVAAMSDGEKLKTLDLYRAIRTVKSTKDIEALELAIRETERKAAREEAAAELKKVAANAKGGVITAEMLAEASKRVFGS